MVAFCKEVLSSFLQSRGLKELHHDLPGGRISAVQTDIRLVYHRHGPHKVLAGTFRPEFSATET
jgi:hypothetical protein